ncbi:DUF308 domain-containing protein [Paenibacillus motobuensis]|uniref:YqeB family protein n=1 Tax=Paenibacillus TaxID=44249 RepID=UPI0020422AF0|nr:MULTISPECIES: DUF308 domain-containing protein [Paenibacillus]MCM3041423.1 DUF308 domain-containing protein [Paenibacillus lutimineralis]MCM3648527.1 DUF308 domain-containing protein [Paenibacillus motobuensis]
MHNQSQWTELGVSRKDKIIIWTLFPILGAVAGWFIPVLAKWVVALPWFPFQGLFKLISSMHGAWGSTVMTVLGFVGGGVLAMIAVKESLQIRLSDREVRLKIHDEERVFERQEVSAIFLDHKQLVLLDMNGRELLREEADGKPKALAEAFIRAGYDWREQDPFAHEYARWVADTPGQPPGANALFLAREKAIGRDDKEDAEDLRKELSKLGVTVRDEKKRQYWRMHGRRP